MRKNKPYSRLILKPFKKDRIIGEEGIVSLSISIFIFFLSLYTLTMRGFIRGPDDETRYLVTESILEDHDLSISPGISKSLGVALGKDGQWYSFHGLGPSLIAIPFYLTGKAIASLFPLYEEMFFTRFFVSLLNQFITAATCMLIFLGGIKFGTSRRVATITSLLYGIATMAWPYSKTFASEPLTTFFLLLATYHAYCFRIEAKYGHLLICGISLGGALITRLAEVIVLPFFLGYVFILTKQFYEESKARWKGYKKSFLLLFSPLIISFLIILSYNKLRFDSFFITGYEGQDFSTPLYVGLYGFLFSSGASIFFYSPIIVLFFWGIKKFYRYHPLEAILFVLLIVVHVLFYSKWWSWAGGFGWWGPRFLLPIIPFFIIPASVLLEKISLTSFQKGQHLLIFTLIVVSVFIQILAISVPPMRFWNEMISKGGFALARSSSRSDAIIPITKRPIFLTYSTILFNPQYSPIIGQWRALKSCSLKKVAPGYLSIERLRNKGFQKEIDKGLDFWFIYLYRLGFPPLLTFIAIIPLLTTTLFAYFIYKFGFRESNW